MCTRNTIPDCRYDDGHVGSCKPWPAWAAELREENTRLRALLLEALTHLDDYDAYIGCDEARSFERRAGRALGLRDVAVVTGGGDE